VVVAVCAGILFVAAIPAEFARLQTVCPAGECSVGQLTREGSRALQGLGLTPGFFAAYAVALDVGFAAAYAAVAALIFWRRPDDRMALFVSLALLTFGAATFTDTMSVLAAEVPVWRLPVAFLKSVGSISFGLFLYLFPDGRFVPRWTRPVAIAWIAWQLPKYWFPSWTDSDPGSPLVWVTFVVWSVALGTAVYAQSYRYRRVSGAMQRQQIKWVVFGMSAGLAGFLGTNLAVVAFAPEPTSPGALLAHLIGHATSYLVMLLIPLSIGVAILRYRLFDINLIINRTLVYGVLTACVVGLYVLVVGGLGVMLQVQGNLLVSILAAGLVAVLFQPLRDRLQRGVNRLMYGERDDPYMVLSRLGRRLETTLAPGTAFATIVETVAGALKLPYAAIELRRDAGFETVAASGDPMAALLRVPLVHGGETPGRLVVGRRPGEDDFSPADRRLLGDLAHQIGVAAHAALLYDEALRLSADLQHSRERLVAAREEERRRLRRDLHDGLGPQLASLTMKAEAARDLVPTDPARAEALLTGLMDQTQSAVADIRRLVYALRPPALDALGLVGALRAHAARGDHGGPRVSVEAPEEFPTLPAAVEVAAYLIALEAVNNAAQHADARNCAVRLWLEDGALRLEVTDDGRGIGEDRGTGVGLSSMRERAAELGGSCTVEALPSGGTRVRALLPCLHDEPDTSEP
jgi:signal transduction histidine kinase